MSTAIEETLKALTEFEAQLDSAKADAAEAKRLMIKNASDWGAAAKASAIADAQRIAAETISAARKEAESEAEKIRKEGQVSMKKLEESLSRRRAAASELVTKRLLGEVE
jgi:vacuolar-type H+-ATPase subunit H